MSHSNDYMGEFKGKSSDTDNVSNCSYLFTLCYYTVDKQSLTYGQGSLGTFLGTIVALKTSTCAVHKH